MKSVLILLLVAGVTLSQAQEYKDNKVIKVTDRNLEKIHLYNFRGQVTVMGTEGNEIVLEIERNLRSAYKDRLEVAKDSVYYDSMWAGNNLYFFVQDPERTFRINEEGFGEYRQCEWNFTSNKERYEIKSEFNVKLTIPKHLNLVAFNHEKEMVVENILGEVSLRNHHDGIVLKGASNNVIAHSHHGDVDIKFAKNPPDFVEVSTHHGDIRASFLPGLSSDVALKTRHGKFFTDYDWQPLPMQVNQTSDGAKFKYKVGEFTRVRIGGGKVESQFETYHGDIIIETNN